MPSLDRSPALTGRALVAAILTRDALVRLVLGWASVAALRAGYSVELLAGGDSPYVQIMLEQHPVESKAGAGPVFRVADVTAFATDNPGLTWLGTPVDIPPGKYGIFFDTAKNPVRVVDFTNDSGRYTRLFRPARAS